MRNMIITVALAGTLTMTGAPPLSPTSRRPSIFPPRHATRAR
ncbi:MAG: hypothetical protein ABJB98_11555 [Actinomycetota bacterium]